jgi:hypothetical protein
MQNNLGKMQSEDAVNIADQTIPSKQVLDGFKDFVSSHTTYESSHNVPKTLMHDEKSNSYYVICHFDAATLVGLCDLEATIESSEDDVMYKLNRDITEDKSAYKAMEEDALHGRSFEDIVVEYDTAYRKNKPLKVYGGQHRVQAVSKALDVKGKTLHGVRVYFALTKEQKVEIATVSNTSIAVPNDLLDRMREQLLGSELRHWCQQVNLLDQDEDFADRRNPDTPTVRIARTLLVNFFLGKDKKEADFHQPVVCKSGGTDETYLELRKNVDWKDKDLLTMGTQFARLHKTQKDTVANRNNDNNAEFARKALSLSVVASWAYAAGLFLQSPDHLKFLYAIPDNAIVPLDPLNAKALSEARLKGTDPDTYRGLGTRSSPPELGRMLEVFVVYASKAAKKRITKELANAAIQSYEAKKATHEANRVLGKI